MPTRPPPLSVTRSGFSFLSTTDVSAAASLIGHRRATSLHSTVGGQEATILHLFSSLPFLHPPLDPPCTELDAPVVPCRACDSKNPRTAPQPRCRATPLGSSSRCRSYPRPFTERLNHHIADEIREPWRRPEQHRRPEPYHRPESCL